ncbi:hypothetical protein JCM33374_g547 [Metschnikowia sp. JCM 33374]|nr:hypothetical protein JCM33374_g547 [Metschnikowia sp. JCM 33374]
MNGIISRVFLFIGIVMCSPIKERLNPREISLANENDPISVLFLVFISVLLVLVLIALGYALKYRKAKAAEYSRLQEDNRAYLDLNSDEQELYFQSKDYLSSNPYLVGDLTLSQNLSIQEKGIRAWEFVKDPMLTNNDLLIIHKHELNFFKKFECSAQTNLPMPMTNDVYYFESKIYSLPNPEETIISIGLGIKPYPWFRLPGRHIHSVSYDSDGQRRHNQPFPFLGEAPFPKLIEGDVVGVGYRVRTGSIFFTRNGKKLSESKIGGHIKNFKIEQKGQIYPIIGANNLCSVHVNVGQLGFVLIEGNAKKWGFAPLQGNEPAPPAYNKFNGDVLLERSEIDEENDLIDRDSDFPPGFLDFDVINGRQQDEANLDSSAIDQITMHSLLPDSPPCYEQSAEHILEDGNSHLMARSENSPPQINNLGSHRGDNDFGSPRGSVSNLEEPSHEPVL